MTHVRSVVNTDVQSSSSANATSVAAAKPTLSPPTLCPSCAQTEADAAQDIRAHQGNRLGPFEVLAPLGSAGMGEVYFARELTFTGSSIRPCDCAPRVAFCCSSP